MSELERRSTANKDDKKIERVVRGTAKVKKKSEVSKLTDVFISEDASNVKEYILMEVLVPAVKKAVSDIVTNGVDMLLYGETRSENRRSSNSSNKVSYRSYYDSNTRRSSETPRERTRHSYDEVIIPTRGEAEEVLIKMEEYLDTYGTVTVGDFYEMCGVSSEYTDHKYGWTSMRNVPPPVRVRDGYIIKMPRALPIR